MHLSILFFEDVMYVPSFCVYESIFNAVFIHICRNIDIMNFGFPFLI